MAHDNPVQERKATSAALPHVVHEASDAQTLLGLAANHAATAATLQAVVQHPNCTNEIRDAVAAHPSTSTATYAFLLTVPFSGADTYDTKHLQRTMARNAACPEEILAWLAQHATDAVTLRLVARHPHTPAASAALAALTALGTPRGVKAPAGLPSWVRIARIPRQAPPGPTP